MPTSGTVPTKQHFICTEYYIKGHVAPDRILSLRDQKQVNLRYESFRPAERAAVSDSFHLRAKQHFPSHSNICHLNPRQGLPDLRPPHQASRETDNGDLFINHSSSWQSLPNLYSQAPSKKRPVVGARIVSTWLMAKEPRQ